MKKQTIEATEGEWRQSNPDLWERFIDGKWVYACRECGRELVRFRNVWRCSGTCDDNRWEFQ